MGRHIAQRTVKLLIEADVTVKQAKVGILGLTFKENVPDLRNSRVPDIIEELRSFGIKPLVHDPLISPEEAEVEYNLSLSHWDQMQELDAVIVAVGHKEFLDRPPSEIFGLLREDGVLVDVKTVFASEEVPANFRYWCL